MADRRWVAPRVFSRPQRHGEYNQKQPNAVRERTKGDLVDFNELRSMVQWLRGEDGVVPESQAASVLARVLRPLLAVDEIELVERNEPNDAGIDFVARRLREERSTPFLGVEYKHRGAGRPLGIADVHQVLGMAASGAFERVMLIGRFGFTKDAVNAAKHSNPVAVELVDLDGLDAWVARVEARQPDTAGKIQLLISSISHRFAELVAADRGALDHLEWRDLERMMARVFEGLGFSVTLTPPSKDGGKDLILECVVSRGEESYVVEIKHWRAGNRVGKDVVSDFLQVIAREGRAGGLLLSSSGFTANVAEGLTEITRQRLRFGSHTKIVLLAQMYVRACSGLWSPPTDLPELLFEGTS